MAILGASSDPTKWGYALARNALRGAHRRSVFLVNRRGEQILGQPSYRSLADLPQPPELVAIVVRAAGFEAAVAEPPRAGALAIVAITAGFGEKDAAGLALQRAMADRVRAAGAVLVGPNCLGIADTGTDLDLTWDRFRPGSAGLISQSGNLGLELAQLGDDAGLGFSRFISVGNQADVDAAECLRALIDHPPTRAIAVYVEDFVDGREFASIAESAAAAGKPVVLLTIGATPASARVAQSHTGALVSDSIAVDAACRASGMYRVETPQQMIDLLQVLLAPHQPAGRRVAIAGDGGGHVALAADRLIARGLLVEPFSDRLSASLAGILPPTATTRNPVDIAGAGEEDVFNFERVVRLMAQSAEARPAESEAAAIAAAAAMGYPVVLKALGATHKSDSGGVRLGISGEAPLKEAFREMQRGLRPTSFSVEKEATLASGIELLIGVKRDRRFGPIALIGLGGISAELIHD